MIMIAMEETYATLTMEYTSKELQHTTENCIAENQFVGGIINAAYTANVLIIGVS